MAGLQQSNISAIAAQLECMKSAPQVLVGLFAARTVSRGSKSVIAGPDPWQNDGGTAKPAQHQSTFSGLPPASSASAETTSNPVANATPNLVNQSVNPWGAVQIDGSGASF